MIQDALNYLRADDDWTRTVLIGGILSLLGVLVVPTLLVFGYLVRVLRGTMHGDDRPPAFDEWGDLFVDGLKAFAITLAYGFVPAAVGTAVVAGGILSFTVVAGGGNGAAAGGLGLAVVIVGSLLALALGLAAAYVVPAATAAFAATDRLRAACSGSDLRPVLLSRTYATAWLSAFVVAVAGGLLGATLSAIPVLGFVIAGFVTFYTAVTAYYIVGHAWGDHWHLDRRDAEVSPREKPAV
jgi:hypothetical protein